jgi:glycerophosphoryl diester phosphodiesterase
MVNLDSKLGIENLKAMTTMARDLGMANQIVTKAYVDTPEKFDAARRVVEAIGADGQFMPLLDDAVSKDLQPLLRAATDLKPEAVELRASYAKGQSIAGDGGLFFGAKARAIAARFDFHLWINTLYSEDPHGLRSGGRGDEMAVLAGLPEEVYGFWVERGATMIQTDEPKAAIEWLEENGYRIPYEQN